MLAMATERPVTRRGWLCSSCHRFLATVDGDRFVRPNGDAGHLPAVIRCKCGRRNVLAAAGELDRRAQEWGT